MTNPTYMIAHGNTAVQAARIIAGVAAGKEVDRPTVAAQQCGDGWRVARPVYHMAMPLTADGNGPASPEETVSHAHEVWDQLCRTLCVCSCAEDAAFITNAVNAYRL